jgi:hypothetical protein
VSRFSTANGAIVLGYPGSVTGRTTDDLTGVAAVTITFSGSNGTQTVGATLTCNASRTDCSWYAQLPIVLLPGTWTVHAVARDVRGNIESNGPTITVFVV